MSKKENDETGETRMSKAYKSPVFRAFMRALRVGTAAFLSATIMYLIKDPDISHYTVLTAILVAFDKFLRDIGVY